MKKLSRKPINPLGFTTTSLHSRGFTTFMKTERGFTLIELLVVVAIIAILSAVGITIFTNAQKGARDAQRKADINSIASAYESKFDSVRGEYSVLADADFQSGKKPTPPEGGNYNFVVGPNHDSSEIGLYKVCAKLGDATVACWETSSNCYCRSSSQTATSAVAAGSCPNFRMPFGGGTTAGLPGDSQSCYASAIYDAGGQRLYPTDVWIKCADLDTTVDCTGGACSGGIGTGPDMSTGNMPFYSSADATTVVVTGRASSDLWLYSRPGIGDNLINSTGEQGSDGISDDGCTRSRPRNGRYAPRITVHLRN